MSLPNTDPSLISNPAPIFQDNSFVRGDHLRANNQAIWTNLTYILNGQLTEPLSASTLTAAGLTTLKAKAVIEAAIKLTSTNVEGAVIQTDADGSIHSMSNVYELAGVIKLLVTGTAIRVRQEGNTGIFYIETYTGTANDVISTWAILLKFGVNNPIVSKGYIGAGLAFQSISTPPTVLAGDRDCGGIGYSLVSDINLTMANAILNASTTLTDHNYCWLWVTQKISDGTFGILPVVDGAQIQGADVSCTGVTIATGTATVSTAGALPAVGTIAIVKGGSVGTIIGKVLTSGAGQFTLKTSAVGTVTGTITYNNYNRIFTAHGGIGAVTLDTDIEKFTPSPVYCSALRGYYLNQFGVPDSNAANAVYRILGIWGNVTQVEYVKSYKSGFEKNDNELSGDTTILSSFGTGGSVNVFRMTIPTRFWRMWGNDYTATDTTSGFLITLNTDFSDLTIGASAYPAASGGVVYIYRTLMGGAIGVFEPNAVLQNASATQNLAPISTRISGRKGDFLYFYASSVTNAYLGDINFKGIL